jgi:hypothetical protein
MGGDDFEIRKADGTTPTGEELARALMEAGNAKEHEMSCPKIDCSGKVEARAPFWLGVTPEGMPFLDAIGWRESGVIACSHGGEEHIPASLRDQLDDTLMAYCSAAETKLGAAKGEDVLPRNGG